MDPVRNGPEPLSRAECLTVLRHAGTGRIAYSQRALPAIVTVGYAVVDDAIALRVDADAPELPSLRNAVVAFQADHTDPGSHQGWSVSCVGRARPVTDDGMVTRLTLASLADVAESRPAFLLLEPELVQGRRVHELPLAEHSALSDSAAPAS